MPITITNHETTERLRKDRLFLSPDFLERIKSFRDKSDIAEFVIKLAETYSSLIVLNKENINYLGISVDDATKISYITYDRVEKANGVTAKYVEDKDYRYHSSAAKVIRKLLNQVIIYPPEDVNYNSEFYYIYIQAAGGADNVTAFHHKPALSLFKESDIDLFNTLFRTAGYRQGDAGEVIFVKGHWIAELYHERNYASYSGTLGNSCMRYDRTNAYLDIYVKNPSICSLAVLLNQEGKVQARALVWEKDEKKYHDRIYYTSDLIHDRMKAFFLTKEIQPIYSSYPGYVHLTFEEDTTNVDFSKRIIFSHSSYPYMDSLKYMSTDKRVLSTDYTSMEKDGEYLIFNCTGGGYEHNSPSTCECASCGREVDEDNTYYIDLRNDPHYQENLCDNCTVYSELHSTSISRSASIYVEHLSDYVLPEDVIEDHDGRWILGSEATELYSGQYASSDLDDLIYVQDRGYYLESDSNDIIEFKNDYYHKDDCVIDRHGNYIPESVAVDVNGEWWLESEHEEHENLNLI